MTEMLDLRDGLQRALENAGEPGSAELCGVLRERLNVGDFADPVVRLRRIKARVFRMNIAPGGSSPSIVCKRLEPAVAQRNRLVADRWLPALGLTGRCARLLATAADRDGQCVWQVYEDLGEETLAMRPDRDRIRATVELVADLHTRAVRHGLLADVRRYTPHLGVEYFVANIGDAIAALESLADTAISPPPEYAGVPDRLRQRLMALLADVPRRAQVVERAAGPDTLLHGDLWPINVFVADTADGLQARLVDWDRLGVGPFSYDLSTFVFRFPADERAAILDAYQDAVARAGWRLASPAELDLLFDTAERARYANRVIWPAQALARDRAPWGFPELAEVERWFCALDAGAASGRRQATS